jgi:hypothetical protein
MKENIGQFSRKIARSFLVYLGTVTVSLPVLAACLLLTLSSAFWLYDALQEETFRYVSRRVLLLLSMPGCLATLVFNGFVIYRVNRYLEERFK